MSVDAATIAAAAAVVVGRGPSLVSFSGRLGAMISDHVPKGKKKMKEK